MSRRKPHDERLGPFVPLLKETIASPAWRAMSHGARSLYVALKARYNVKQHNNGKLHISQRIASNEVGSSFGQIARWFRELQHYGFIVQTKGGSLGLNGKGTAPHWRLTECGYMHEPPACDFLKWDGRKFEDAGRRPRKTESRCGKPQHFVAENRNTSVAESRNTIGSKCCGKPQHV
jgi:hypothetical protein